MYKQTGIGALRSIRRIVVVTVLTRNSSDFALILDMASFRGKVTPSIVGAWAGDRAQLTCRNACTRDPRLQCQ